MKLSEHTISTEYKFNGRLIRLRTDTVLLPNGNRASREIVEHSGGVGVVALTDDGRIMTVRQYRHAMKEVVLEIPAGKLEKGEEPLLAAKRELAEEVGVTAENWHYLGPLYATPGYCEEVDHLYLATGLTLGESHPDPDEFLERGSMPLTDAVDAVMRGDIPDAKTQTAILKVQRLIDLDEI